MVRRGTKTKPNRARKRWEEKRFWAKKQKTPSEHSNGFVARRKGGDLPEKKSKSPVPHRRQEGNGFPVDASVYRVEGCKSRRSARDLGMEISESGEGVLRKGERGS